MARNLLRGLSALAAIAIVGLAHEAHADKVGVAAAVNPDAFSSLAGSPQSQLNIGKSIFYNERINTTGSGLVQVLLVDGSTFTVGPGSDLVIDRFVYDPKKGTGQITASFSKGVMRFVGGKISKNEGGVRVDTPAGTLAIRGGISYGQFISPKNYAFLLVFGDYLKMNGLTVFEPGNGIFAQNGQPVIREFTAADVSLMMAALTNSNTGGVGPKPSEGPASFKLVNTDSMNQLISDFNTQQILGEAKEASNDQTESPPEPPCVGEECNPPPAPPPPSCEELGNCPPPPPPPSCEELGNCPPPPPPPDDTTDNTPNPGGYAAGVVVSDQPQKGFKNAVAGTSPGDFLPGGESVSTVVLRDIQNHDPATSRYELSFGSDPAATVFDQNGVAYTQSSVTGQTLLASDPLCDQCAFFEWGTFSTEVSFSNGQGTTQYIDQIAGYWVSGDLASTSQIDKLAKLGAPATYNGYVLGNVIIGNDGRTYNATGDLFMGWNFGTRSGELQISNFDNQNFEGGLTFGGDLTQVPSGANQFTGSLSGSSLTGSATGSFVRGPDSPVQGVIGDWNVSRSGYRATGIFAGTQLPATQ
jgi:hypothetical protein